MARGPLKVKTVELKPMGYDPVLEEEDMPDVVQVETMWIKESEEVYNSRGKLVKDTDYLPKCSDLHVELQKHANDPKTGIPTLTTFHENIKLPFRTDDNPFTRHHGFTARDVTRFIWHMPGKDKAFQCKEVTKEQIAAERKAKREMKDAFKVPIQPADEYEGLRVIDDGSEGYNASHSVTGVGRGASPVMA